MKSKLILFVLLFVANGLFSQGTVEIKGEIRNSDFEEVYLYDLVGENRIASSGKSRKGKFKIEAAISATNFYRLMITEYDFVFLTLSPGDKLEVIVDVHNIKNPIIKGSKQSQLAYTALNKMADYDEQIKNITEKIHKEKRAYIRDLVKQNQASLSTLFFLEEMDNEKDYELYKETVQKLYKKYPQNTMVLELNEKVNKKRIVLNTVVPDISLPDKDGKIISLSSLRGKYVLVYFGDAWCGPCRKEMPDMVKLYEKYRFKDFEIYSISFDKSNDVWEKALAEDGAMWTSVIDRELRYKEVFNIKSIPYTLLIDKKGNIIAKNIRGLELEKKISEILN